MTSKSCAETDLRVDDIARLSITASPYSQEADFTKIGNPFCKDLRNYF
jgi:hypothetical protein